MSRCRSLIAVVLGNRLSWDSLVSKMLPIIMTRVLAALGRCRGLTVTLVMAEVLVMVKPIDSRVDRLAKC